MSSLTYAESGVTHKVVEFKSGKVIRFSRRNSGERWQNPCQYQNFISCVVWKDVLSYMQDQRDWEQRTAPFSRQVKSRQRFFWVKEELAALRRQLKQFQSFALDQEELLPMWNEAWLIKFALELPEVYRFLFLKG